VQDQEVDGMDVRRAQSQRETVDRLRCEVEELRASRTRLVLAADALNDEIEREFHEGLQQQLVAISVGVERASALVEPDTAAAALLAELADQVRDALDEAARLAERIHLPLLERGRLAAALRSAAASAGVPASVQVTANSSYPPEVARTVLLSWLVALTGSETGRRAAVTVREQEGMLVFEIVSTAELDGMRDRVEALGGRLEIEPMPAGGARVSGLLPLSRRP
jgi:signal transduction histidine kinase